MKKIFIICAVLLMTANVFLPRQVAAQAPEKFSYQAVVRDAHNKLVTEQSIGMRIRIWKGSANDVVVYTETQTSTTNANGLVSIEVGDGTVISGNFTTIDWGSDLYFIEVGIDPSGGSNYSITITSQLLSVPYSLHSKTAETIVGGFVEADGSETKIIAEDNIIITGSGTTADPYVIKTKTYKVGDFAFGGIVFYVDETGQHGLVCAKQDQSSAVRWYAGTNTRTMATGRGLKAGSTNTALIIASQGGGDGDTYAALICNELDIKEGGITYGGWYLPSLGELKLMYENKAIIDSTALANGGSSFSDGYYWSSSEHHDNYVWNILFSDGFASNNSKYTKYPVRAVRAF